MLEPLKLIWIKYDVMPRLSVCINLLLTQLLVLVPTLINHCKRVRPLSVHISTEYLLFNFKFLWKKSWSMCVPVPLNYWITCENIVAIQPIGSLKQLKKILIDLIILVEKKILFFYRACKMGNKKRKKGKMQKDRKETT